jgi:hypothetical protein
MNRLLLPRFAVVCCLLLAFTFATLPNAVAQSEDSDSQPVVGLGFVVQDFYGGQILGYGVDQSGNEGMLSEYVELPDGNLLIATETFDQNTGHVLFVTERQTETQDNFVTLGVWGSHIGLRQDQHVQGLYVVRRTYNTINPLSGNRFTGIWTPPINDNTQFFEDVEGVQGNPNVAVMASDRNCCGRVVFGSNLGANRFGPIIRLTDPIFTGGVPPLLAYDSVTNQAVLAQAQGAPYSTPEFALVDLTTRNVTEFWGFGDGFVNGLAVDSATGIACTTTETDNRAEFYNLATHNGFEVNLPVIGQYSGATVANDPVNKVFLITHPVPGSPGQIHVYDENGNLIESIRNISLPPAGATLALNPSARRGFLQVPGRNGHFSALQSFTY